MNFKTAEDAIVFLGTGLLQPQNKEFSLTGKRRSYYEYLYYALAGDAALVPFSNTGIQNAAELAAKDPEFDAHKGICLIGDIGIGKSVLWRVMGRLFNNTACGFKRISATYIAECAMDDELGEDYVLETYGTALHYNLYIDDAGLENRDKKYGNVINVIRKLILQRADLFFAKGYKTHLSTNVATAYNSDMDNSNTLLGLYGQREYDRLMEMCNVLTWRGASLRSNNTYSDGGINVQG